MIKKVVRDQTYSIATYLKRVNDGDICENADVQRLAGNFDKREINELIYTTLTGDHIPELILAECNEDSHTYITDGLQRTTIMKMFKNGYKLTTAIDNPIVTYMGKKRDSNGNVMKNERGQVEFEEVGFDIRNKTYNDLPEELKKEFDDFQLRVVIHEDCTMKRISELIKRYNYQRPMTVSQKAFTYMDNFAVQVRAISNMRFFIECEGYSEAEKINGTIERVIAESVMCMFHLNNWKKSPKSVCAYLNKFSNNEEFNKFTEVIERLGKIYTPEFNNIFTSKNSFIWFRVFNEFTKYGWDDDRFSEFINLFNRVLKNKIVTTVKYKDMKNVTYSKLDKETGTKDTSLINAKLDILDYLMREYFDNQDTEDKSDINLKFIAENLDMEVDDFREDMDFYEETLDSLLNTTIKDGSKLLDKQNRLSLLAMVVFSFKEDIDLDGWLTDYAAHNNTYYLDQKRNFLHMQEDFKCYITNKTGKET